MRLEVPGARVRALTFDDAPALQRLLRACAAYFKQSEGRAPSARAALERLADAAGDASVTLLGVEREEQLAGILELRRNDDQSWTIALLLLAPDARGQGLGRKLVTALLAAAAEAGVSAVSLGVQDHELGAHAFWQAMGFAAVQHLDGVTDYVRAP